MPRRVVYGDGCSRENHVSFTAHQRSTLREIINQLVELGDKSIFDLGGICTDISGMFLPPLSGDEEALKMCGFPEG